MVVALADVGDGLGGRNTVEDGQAGQGGAGPASTTAARDLDALPGGPLQDLDEGVTGASAVCGKTEVRPAEPAGGPWRGNRFAPEKVEPELGWPPGREGLA